MVCSLNPIILMLTTSLALPAPPFVAPPFQSFFYVARYYSLFMRHYFSHTIFHRPLILCLRREGAIIT